MNQGVWLKESQSKSQTVKEIARLRGKETSRSPDNWKVQVFLRYIIHYTHFSFALLFIDFYRNESLRRDLNRTASDRKDNQDGIFPR